MTKEELINKYKNFVKITIQNKNNNYKETHILDLNNPRDVEIGKRIRKQTTFKATKLTYIDMLECEDWEQLKKEL